MRKFMFLFVLCGLVSGQAWGDVSNFNLVVKPNDPGADEYIKISDRGYAECYDGDHGSVKKGNYVYIYTGGTDVAKRKCIQDFLDYKWELAGDLKWCSGSQLSDGYGSDYIFEGRSFGVRIPGGNTSKLAERARDYVLASTSGTACVICKYGYEQKGNDCVEKVKGCTYLGQTVNSGYSVSPADVGECKRVYLDSGWTNVDKIKSCRATCEDSGTMRYNVLQCVDGYKRGDVADKTACVEEAGNNDNNRGGGDNDNGSTTKCSAGSSKDITSQKNCEKGQTFECTDSKDGKCICGKCKVASVPPAESSLERCLKGRTSAEGQACCYLPASVAKWENNKCVCQTPNMEFKIGSNGRGQCNAKPVAPGATFNCEPSVMGILETWLMQCATKADIVSTITQIKALCASPSRTADNFNTLYSTLLALNPGDCAAAVQPVQPVQQEQPVVPIDDTAEKLRKSRRNISDAHAILVSMRETFKASVWKDEEGKFNTSRLVSDSIAGVVLGTVGGVVTSNVVKKNQVENGFEDIKCTVGGQTVADWGDEFRVGIQ